MPAPDRHRPPPTRAPCGSASRRSSPPIAASSRRTGCPRRYRKTLMRQIASTRTRKSSACCPKATGSPARRRLQRKAILLAKVQDEAGHGLYLYCGGRDARRQPRPAAGALHERQGEVQLDLQLPDADLGRCRRDRLAGRRRGHHEPGAALPLLLRAVCARDDPHLQGRELPPAPGLRALLTMMQRHGRAAGDGAGRGEPLVVAVADDVRPARRRQRPLGAVDALGHQAHLQRRAAAAVRGHDRPQAKVLGVTLPDPS